MEQNNLQVAVGYPKLILASASPRRREILADAGLAFEVRAADIDERHLPGESPEQLVSRLAAKKALVVRAALDRASDKTPTDWPILAADTVVVIGGAILGKPAVADEARAMLVLLSGAEHEVLTGVALLFPATQRSSNIQLDVRVASTRVRFRTLSKEQIEDYINSGEPYDKAGGYGIQGLAAKYVERIEGCYFNVVGLPIALVCAMLEEHASTSHS